MAREAEQANERFAWGSEIVKVDELLPLLVDGGLRTAGGFNDTARTNMAS